MESQRVSLGQHRKYFYRDLLWIQTSQNVGKILQHLTTKRGRVDSQKVQKVPPLLFLGLAAFAVIPWTDLFDNVLYIRP